MEQLSKQELERENNGWRKYERLVLAEVKRGAEERAKMQADLQLSMGKMEDKVEHTIEKSEARHEDAIVILGKEIKELRKAFNAFLLEQQKEITSIKTHLRISWFILSAILVLVIAKVFDFF